MQKSLTTSRMQSSCWINYDRPVSMRDTGRGAMCLLIHADAATSDVIRQTLLSDHTLSKTGPFLNSGLSINSRGGGGIFQNIFSVKGEPREAASLTGMSLQARCDLVSPISSWTPDAAWEKLHLEPNQSNSAMRRCIGAQSHI